MGGAVLDGLPGWVTLLRAPNPGPMTLDGTNTWVLRAPGEEQGFVIDPGPLDEGHLRAIAEHAPFRAILITHGHHDHVEGAPRLSAMLGGTPVLAAVEALVGLGRVVKIVKVVGFVASAPGFTGQPAVVNGASNLFGEVFGEQGRHARSAVGVAELPLGAPVEVEAIIEVA